MFLFLIRSYVFGLRPVVVESRWSWSQRLRSTVSLKQKTKSLCSVFLLKHKKCDLWDSDEYVFCEGWSKSMWKALH